MNKALLIVALCNSTACSALVFFWTALGPRRADAQGDAIVDLLKEHLTQLGNLVDRITPEA